MDEEYYTLSGVITLIGAVVITIGLYLDKPTYISAAILAISVGLVLLELVSEDVVTLSAASWFLIAITGVLGLAHNVFGYTVRTKMLLVVGIVVVLGIISIVQGVFGSVSTKLN